MKNKGLAYYLKYPERIRELTDEELNNWIELYPYAQSLRMLKARRDLDTNSTTMASSIMNAAAYSNDLVFLRYQLLKDQAALDQVAHELETTTSVDETVRMSKKENMPSDQDQEPEQDKAKADDVQEEVTTDLDDVSSEVEHPESQELSGERIDSEEKDEVETKKPMSKEQKAEIVDTILKEHESELSGFTKWLIKQERGVDLAEEKSGSKSDKKKKKRSDQKKKKKKKKKKAKSKKKNKLQKLIEYSIVEDEEAVTETYADLLAAQGHIDKAVELYSKLQLKFPEKSGYFARKIDELQNS